MLEQQLQVANDLKKEFDTLVASKKQVDADNETLRKTITDMLEQLKTTEQRVTNRFANELKTKAEQLQKETVKTTSLNTLVNTLKDSKSTVTKEIEKLKNENRLMSVKYSNQAAEHAATFTVRSNPSKKSSESPELLSNCKCIAKSLICRDFCNMEECFLMLTTSTEDERSDQED